MNNLKNLIRSTLPRSIKPHRILSGYLQGEWIVTSWHDYPAAILGYTERPLIKWFSENVAFGETWLDVGAHYGYTAIALSRLVGERGRVFAFEPMPITAGYLAQTRQKNKYSQLVVLPFGLTDEIKLKLLHLPVVRGMVDSTVNNDQVNWFETIIAIGLNQVWSSICEENPCVDGIKIDVQGMEIEVLKGMKSILMTYKPKLVIEVHQGVDRQRLLGVLGSVGYSLEGVPVEPLVGEEKAQYFDNHSYVFIKSE